MGYSNSIYTRISGDTNYSMQYGENTVKTVQKCGMSMLSIISDGDNAQDERCNIYDMAGNTFEWTTETDYVSGYPCTYRGGNSTSGYYTIQVTDILLQHLEAILTILLDLFYTYE